MKTFRVPLLVSIRVLLFSIWNDGVGVSLTMPSQLDLEVILSGLELQRRELRFLVAFFVAPFIFLATSGIAGADLSPTRKDVRNLPAARNSSFARTTRMLANGSLRVSLAEIGLPSAAPDDPLFKKEAG